MADFDFSSDSGGEITGGNSFDSVDISENETEVDINSNEESSVDISGESNIEVTIPSGTEVGTEINIANETEKNSFVSLGDSNIDNHGKVSIGDSNRDKPGEVKVGDSTAGTSSEVIIDETNISKSIEVDTEQDGKDKIGENGFDNNEALKEYLEKESPYSIEVNKYISSPEELQVYKEAGLVEKNIDGRVCLIREDLDLEYVDKQSGLTNAELIAKGRAPYDAKTGERIELHHIGQDFNAPFAELQSVSEHDIYSKTLHKSETDSWRRDPEKVRQYSEQRKAHWKNRV